MWYLYIYRISALKEAFYFFLNKVLLIQFAQTDVDILHIVYNIILLYIVYAK